MGDIADYYIDRQIEGPARDRPKEVIWITGTGERLRPADMTSIHLMNCIHLCERREGHMGKRALNSAPTYKHMVRVLVWRGKLTWGYLDLPIHERLAVRIEE